MIRLRKICHYINVLQQHYTYDKNTTNDSILQQVPLGRLKSILTKFIEDEALISLSIIIPRIISIIDENDETSSSSSTDSSNSDSDTSSYDSDSSSSYYTD